MSSALMRRSAVTEVGGIPADIHITPDYFLYLAVCSKFSGARGTRGCLPLSVARGEHDQHLPARIAGRNIYGLWTMAGPMFLAGFARRRAHISTALADCGNRS